MGNSESKKLKLKRARENLNKFIVQQFYEKVICARDITKIDQFVSKTYIEHSSMIGGDGIDVLKLGLKAWFDDFDEFFYIVRHMVCDGDLVFVYAKYLMGKDHYAKCVDIFRIKHGKLAEHWDITECLDEHMYKMT